jgi:hypothetical protein
MIYAPLTPARINNVVWLLVILKKTINTDSHTTEVIVFGLPRWTHDLLEIFFFQTSALLYMI